MNQDMTASLITFAPFQSADQDEVKQLILAGLKEHWGEINPDLNPDLNHIQDSYKNAYFLVARLGERIVGCGALIPHPPHTGEIVRMSVASDQRRLGLGGVILHRLINQAHALGLHQVILETTSTWGDVVAFYQHNGFRITHFQGGDTYFALDLPPEV